MPVHSSRLSLPPRRPAAARACRLAALGTVVGLAAPAGAAEAAAAADCRPPQWLVERFISADCEACWRTEPPMPAPRGTAVDRAFVLDWIVPGARGADAPLAVPALAEATPRAARAGSLQPDEALTQTTPLPARSALRLEVQDGVAWNGYIGLRFKASYAGGRPLPPGLAGWLGLAERIPAGSEGTPVVRQLVRVAIGPLSLDGLAQDGAAEHLRAVRLPENAQPERLTAVGWLETPDGRVRAVAATANARCAPGADTRPPAPR